MDLTIEILRQPPVDSGDGTQNGIPIINYKVQVRLEDGSLIEQVSSPTASRSAVLKITAGVSYIVHINAVTSVSDIQSNSAGLLLAYSGNPIFKYDVPLAFAFSTTTLIAPVGSSTSFLITPLTPPYMDAFVKVTRSQISKVRFELLNTIDKRLTTRWNSSNEQSATATANLIFKKGSVAPQYVIVSHMRKGVTMLSFRAKGSYFKGLDTSVTVETLAA